MIVTINNEYASASVNTTGAELVSLKISDKEYIWQGGNWKEHSPVLFPICGRLSGPILYGGEEYTMKIHGFIRFSEFETVEKSDAKVVLKYTSTDEDYKLYPFYFDFYAIFELKGSDLYVDFKVVNRDEKKMYYQFGWHPGFNLLGDGPIDNFTLDFGKDACPTQHLVNESKFVSGALASLPLLDGIWKISEKELYEIDTVILTETEGKVTLSSSDIEETITLEYSDNLKYLAIWKWPKSEDRYLCLEPWSGIPGDGVSPEVLEERINMTLETGEEEVYSYVIRCK